MRIRVSGDFQALSAKTAVPESIAIRTIGLLVEERVLRPSIISGAFVCRERKMAQRVVLPLPFSPKINVNFLNVTSPEAEAARKRPIELMSLTCWIDMPLP